jgi:hypothetical protein
MIYQDCEYSVHLNFIESILYIIYLNRVFEDSKPVSARSTSIVMLGIVAVEEGQ